MQDPKGLVFGLQEVELELKSLHGLSCPKIMVLFRRCPKYEGVGLETATPKGTVIQNSGHLETYLPELTGSS